MKFLRVALCAAAVGFASAAMDQLTLPVPASFLKPFALAHAEAHGVELEQSTFRPVRPDDIVRVAIDRNSPGLSDVCYDSLLGFQNDPFLGETVDVILGEVASQCIRIVGRDALATNQDALITTIACPIQDYLSNLTATCGEVNGAGVQGGTVADFTITQDITRTDRPNFFVRLSQDYYQCIPFNTQGCSAADVEAVAVALASGLAAGFFADQQAFIDDVDNNLNGVEPVVDVRYSVTGLVFDSTPSPPPQNLLAPQGIFGLGEAFVTTTMITGASSALSLAQPGALFVRSDDLNFPDVEVLSPIGQSAPELCKNMAASLNTDSAFRASRCVADCQERELPDAQLNIWCPITGAVLIREGQRGLPPPGIAQPITNFDAAQTGFRFTGSPSSTIPISRVATNAPAQNQQPATLRGGNPILAPGVGLPIATLPVDPESDGSSSLAPTAVTTAVCLVFAVVSRRFC